jgi:hypothetical protein
MKVRFGPYRSELSALDLFDFIPLANQVNHIRKYAGHKENLFAFLADVALLSVYNDMFMSAYAAKILDIM